MLYGIATDQYELERTHLLRKQGAFLSVSRVTVLLAAAFVLLLLSGLDYRAFAAPQIGYAYPAGGQRGRTFRIEVGGQSLRNVNAVRFTGQGVRASVVEYVPPLSNQDYGKTRRFLNDVVRRRWNAGVMEKAAKEKNEPPLPDHPWLRDIDGKSPNELALLRTRLFDPRKQPNAQIQEQVVIEVTIAPDAETGKRELRLSAPEGLSNPLCFQVGKLPEVSEENVGGGAAAPVMDTPVLLNGRITPGETDRFHVRAGRGQKLVMALRARDLIPYLADAVPGWFQATMTLYDPDEKEVAWSDDYRFDPDPVLLYEVPADGIYKLEVRDAIFRGRDDFVYRISVGELPFVTHIFPLGGRVGTRTDAVLHGWNLPRDTLPLDTRPLSEAMRIARFGTDYGFCNDIVYAVNSALEAVEHEPNDKKGTAQLVGFPQTVNGRIDRSGDVDVFRFEGRANQEIVAEVYARRLNSPVDSVLRLTDSKGVELVLNDDHKDPEMGLITHHADSYAGITLPRDGEYVLYLSDAQDKGGEAFSYRLLLREARPNFALRLVPSCINLRPGGSAKVTVHALRKDGFEGDISLALVDAPEGFALRNAQISADKESVVAVLQAPRDVSQEILKLEIEGSAEIDGAVVAHRVVPAEDMMQAFLWRFLVPRQELVVAFIGSKPVPSVWRPLARGFEVTDRNAVRIPLGGTASVHVKAPRVLPDDQNTSLSSVSFRLCNRPRGVTLLDSTRTATGVALNLKTDANTALKGDTAHLIVEVFAETKSGEGRATSMGRTTRVDLGVLPAIAYEIAGP